MSLLRATFSRPHHRPWVRAFANHSLLDIHPEVQTALQSNTAVVALETALVTHGLPYPESLNVPLALESIVRSTGAVPATIGIIDGRVKIGLERHELERLAGRHRKPAKISRRDVAAAITTGSDGGTTCSATLLFAALAGIKVFATGGLGGVHRGGENSMDVSADLQELTRCPVGLVSSGVKSILDIGRTLEYLESLGVPVVAYGASKQFPAFFTRHSGFEVPWNITSPEQAGRMIYTQHQLKMKNGVLIAVPIPESYEAVGQRIQASVDQAVAESEANGINKQGKDATPWLLSRIAELTKGDSLSSNIALLENTALVGGQIAVAYSKLSGSEFLSSDHLSKNTFQPCLPRLEEGHKHKSNADVVVVGCTALDITAQALPGTDTVLARYSTSPGHVKLSLGGVGRNIAEATHRVMQAKYPLLSSVLVAPVGSDGFADIIRRQTGEFGMRTDGLLVADASTAICNMVLDSEGALVGGIADMDITAQLSAVEVLPKLTQYSPKIVALDGNLSANTLAKIVKHCNDKQFRVLFEPTSRVKSTAILPAVAESKRTLPNRIPVTFCTPNLLELTTLYEAIQSEEHNLSSRESWWSMINSFNLGSAFRMDLELLARRSLTDDDTSNRTLGFIIEQGVAQMAINLLPCFQHLIIKCGDEGVVVVMMISPEEAAKSPWKQERSNPGKRYIVAQGRSQELVIIQHHPPLKPQKIVNVTGAGDSFVGALLASLAHEPEGLWDPESISRMIRTAQSAAILTLNHSSAVSPFLSARLA